MNIEKEVRERLKQISLEQGVQIVDVAYLNKDTYMQTDKELPNNILRVYLAKEPEITTEDCSKFAKATNELINEIKPTGSLVYEVLADRRKRSGVKDLHTEIMDKVVCANDAVNTDDLWYFFSDSKKPVLMPPLAGESLKRETSDKNRVCEMILPSSIFNR